MSQDKLIPLANIIHEVRVNERYFSSVQKRKSLPFYYSSYLFISAFQYFKKDIPLIDFRKDARHVSPFLKKDHKRIFKIIAKAIEKDILKNRFDFPIVINILYEGKMQKFVIAAISFDSKVKVGSKWVSSSCISIVTLVPVEGYIDIHAERNVNLRPDEGEEASSFADDELDEREVVDLFNKEKTFTMLNNSFPLASSVPSNKKTQDRDNIEAEEVPPDTGENIPKSKLPRGFLDLELD